MMALLFVASDFSHDKSHVVLSALEILLVITSFFITFQESSAVVQLKDLSFACSAISRPEPTMTYHNGCCSILVCIVLFFVCFGVFQNSLDNEFVFDDHLAIVNNADTDPSTPFVDLWRHDIWGKDLMAHDSHRSYRPFLIIIFKLLRQQFGLDARSIRIASVLSHAVSSVLVYFLGIQVLCSWHVSFASALLFALHPVHVESVAAVVNIAEPLSCIFFCATFMMYLSNISPEESESAVEAAKTGSSSLLSTMLLSILKKLVQWSLWICFLITSILFKETGITVLGLIFGNSVLNIVSMSVKKIIPLDAIYTVKTSFSKHISWMLFSLLMLVGYFVFRAVIVSPDRDTISDFDASGKCDNQFYSIIYVLSSKVDSLLSMVSNSIVMLNHLLVSPFLTLRAVVMGGSQDTDTVVTSSVDTSSFYLDDSALIRKAENPFAFLQGQEKVLSLMYLHFRYFFLMVWPVQLSPEYAFNCIPSVASWEDDGNYRAVYGIVTYVSIFVTALCGFGVMIIRGGGISRSNSSKDILNSAPSGHAILVSVMLMVIPFIPAAGVFLRLGTLLAERLFYVPSIGFCYLLCLFLFLMSRLVCRALRLSDASGSKTASLFWGVVFSISCFYALRTHRRNVDWKTDTDLFLASLDVCPTSAKLNLQVTKIYVNRGDFADAERHIAAAKAIDPEFCDIWYQEALMNVLYYNNMDEAISKLSDSLKCVFTSSGALQLLQSIWNQEIQKSPKDYKTYEKIADVGFKAEMLSVAVQYFQQGAVMATEQLKYSDALKLSKKTEKAVNLFYARTDFNVEDNSEGKLSYLYREMTCNMYGLGGLLRSRLYEDYHANDYDAVGGRSNKQLSSKKQTVSKAVLQQINRRDKYLTKALQVNCVYEITESKDIFNKEIEIRGISLSNYALTVLSMHIGNLSANLQKIKQLFQMTFQRSGRVATSETTFLKSKLAEECKALALVLEQGAKLYEESFRLRLNRYYENMQILQTQSSKENFKKKKKNAALNIQNVLEKDMQEAKESRDTAITTAVHLYLDAGEAFFDLKNYSSAKSMFEHVVHFNDKIRAIAEQEDAVGKEVFHHPTMAAKAQWLEDIIAEKNLLPNVAIPCKVHYWCAHALASASLNPNTVVYDLELRGEIHEHLLKMIHCADTDTSAPDGESSVNNQMREYARSQLKEIDFMIEYVDGDLEDP